MQYKPNTKRQDLLKSKKAKIRKLSELSKTEHNRLAKLNALPDELTRGEKSYPNSITINTMVIREKQI
jgi:hypothetical protein